MKNMRNLWEKCSMELREWRHEKKELGKGTVLGILICWLFYDRIWIVMFIWPLLVPWMRQQREKRKWEERETLRKDVREMMQFVSNGLSVGYSLENALKAAYQDMKEAGGSEPGRLIRELEILTETIKVNSQADRLLLQMADRIDLEELRQFAEIVSIVKRSGGNLIEIVSRTAEHLGQSLQIKEEIRTVTAAKRMEKKVMSVMPYFILVYVRITNPGYFQVLYDTVPGILLSTVCLAALIAAGRWAERVIMIEI